MATAAQIAANIDNAQHSSGPHTDAGKQCSSRNAVKLGLFSLTDYVRPDEAGEYQQIAAAYWQELAPQGIAEEKLVAAIVGASWRLRRCSLVEGELAVRCPLDPMLDEEYLGEHAAAARSQRTVDRARSAAYTVIRRSTAELRELQTARLIPGNPVASRSTTGQALSPQPSVNGRQPSPELASFCTEPKPIPRSAPCPCGSGEKFKRCCGKDAPPVLGRAA